MSRTIRGMLEFYFDRSSSAPLIFLLVTFALAGTVVGVALHVADGRHDAVAEARRLEAARILDLKMDCAGRRGGKVIEHFGYVDDLSFDCADPKVFVGQ